MLSELGFECISETEKENETEKQATAAGVHNHNHFPVNTEVFQLITANLLPLRHLLKACFMGINAL